MRVLVTRPEAGAAKTASALVAMGHEPVLLPLFEPVYLPLHDLPQTDAITVTSANALRAIEMAGAVEPLKEKPVFAVGKATARAAENLGFETVTASSGSGATLAQYIATALPQEKTLLYLAGEPRSPVFEETLQASGRKVQTRLSYRMRALEHDATLLDSIFKSELDAILLYSKETAERFFTLCEEPLKRMRGRKLKILCLSQNVAAAVPEDFNAHVFVAQIAAEESLLQLL